MRYLTVLFLIFSSQANANSKVIPLKDGVYKFQHKFQEHPSIISIPVVVTIKKNWILVTNKNKSNVFSIGELENGEVSWHAKTQSWFIKSANFVEKSSEVGPCVDGSSMIDFTNKIYWTC